MFLYRTLQSFFRDKIYRELLISIIVLVAVSTVFFRYIEDWTWLDSFYFSISTITTTGYGDLYPKSEIGKIYNIFFLILSLILILMFINTMNVHYIERKKVRDRKERQHQIRASNHGEE